MDTFSHSLIAFLLLGKFDLSLAAFAGIAAAILDFDVILYPLSRKYPIFRHRGVGHSIPGVLIITAVASLIFSGLFSTNIFLTLGAGLVGAYAHTLCDTLTNYGTLTFWPFIREDVKLDVIVGIDPLTTIASVLCIPFLARSYRIDDVLSFNLIYLIGTVFFICYFLLRISLKLIIHFKYHVRSLPMINFFKYKLVEISRHEEESLTYKKLKWKKLNLITGHFTAENQFSQPILNPTPPLDTKEKMIAYSYKIRKVKLMLAHSRYHVGQILHQTEDSLTIFWHALELESGRFRMGAAVFLKSDGTHVVKRVYKQSTLEKYKQISITDLK